MANYRRRLDLLEDADFEFLINVQEQNYRETIEVYNYTYVRRTVEQIEPQIPTDMAPQYATPMPDTSRSDVDCSQDSSILSLLGMSGNASFIPATKPNGPSYLESNIASDANNRSEPRWNRNGVWQAKYASNVQYTSSTVCSEITNLPHDSAHFGRHMVSRRTHAIGVVAPYSSAYTPIRADSNLAPRTSQSGIGAASNSTICASQSWSNLANSSALCIAPRRTQAVGGEASYTTAYAHTEADSNLAPSTSQSGIGAATNSTICASQLWSNLANSSALCIAPRRTQAVGGEASYTTAYAHTEADSNLAPSTSQSGIDAACNSASNTKICASHSWSDTVNDSTQAVLTPYDSNLARSTSQSRIGAAYNAASNTTICASQSRSDPVNVSTQAVPTPYTSACTPKETDSNLARSTSQSGIGAAYYVSYAASNTAIWTGQSWSSPAHGSTQSQSNFNRTQHKASTITVRTAPSRNNLDQSSTVSLSNTVSHEVQHTANTTVRAAQSWSNLGSNLARSTSQSGIGAAYYASYAASNTAIWTGQSWTSPAHGSTQSQSNINRTQHKASTITVRTAPSRNNLDQSSTVSQSNTVSHEVQHTANTTVRAAQSWSNLGSTQSHSKIWSNEAQSRAPKSSVRNEQAWYDLVHASTQSQSNMVSHEALRTTVRTAETSINLGHGSTQPQSNIALNEAQDTTPNTNVCIAQSRSNLTTVTSQSKTGANVFQHTTSSVAVSSTESRNLADTSQSRTKIAPDACGPAQPQAQNIMTKVSPSSQKSSQVTPQASTSRDEKCQEISDKWKFRASIISNATSIQSRNYERKRNFFAWDKCVRKHISITLKTERHGTGRNEGRNRTKNTKQPKAKKSKAIKMMYECKMMNCHHLRNLENMIRHLSTDHGIDEPNLRRDTYTHIVCPTCQASVRERVYNKHVLKWHSRLQKKMKNAKKQ